MIRIIRTNIVFLVILILATMLRIWGLNQYPAGFNADEAAIGYNAYSLLYSGKDEYGTSWPLTFKSFGDFKPGLYFYITAPFVATLGLNEWAVRLPSAILGIFTVIFIYFLAKEIFQTRLAGILSSLLLAISPWHIHFSRGAWETNAATFFITFGILLFIKGLRDGKLLFWSLLSFLASMYTYQSPRLIIPFLLLVLLLLYRKSLAVMIRITATKEGIIKLILLTILAIPLLFQFTTQSGTARFSGLSFLADTGPISRVNELRGEHSYSTGMTVRFIHNKLIAYGTNFLGHYLDHFHGDFLFINGDQLLRNKVPETGQFYLVEAIFLIIGLFVLIRSKIPHRKLLLSWILIAPLASSMTYQTPHALRALNLVIPLTLVMGYGLLVCANKLKKSGRIIFITIITVILLFEFIHYLESYYIHYPRRYPIAWEYGFKEMVEKLGIYEDQYKNIVITDRYDQPYILVLFYKKYNPEKYQPQAVLSPRDKFNFGTVRGFDKYQFRSINQQEVNSSEDTLFIGTEEEIPKDAKILDTVNFPNGESAFVFATKKASI